MGAVVNKLVTSRLPFEHEQRVISPRLRFELFWPVIRRADAELQLIAVQFINAELSHLVADEVDLSRALGRVQLECPFFAPSG
jgi:hypothetical protein